MPTKLSCPRIIIAKIAHGLVSLHADRRGNVAVMMGFLLPIMIGALGLGFEVSNWYLQTRAMQNAADAAAIAAASNGGSNYDVEAKAVVAQYGFVDGSNNVKVTATNNATCPTGPNINPPCYKVTITSTAPLYLSQVVGYSGDTTLNGTQGKTLSSAAIANKPIIKQPVCLLGLDKSGQAVTTNGSPNADFTGCTVMSNSGSSCNGSDLKAFMGVAAGTNNGCGEKQYSDAPPLDDPYLSLANNIPPDNCGGSYPQEAKGAGGKYTVAASNQWTGTKALSGSLQVCGDLQLTGNVTIDTAVDGAVLVVQNGRLDLNGYSLKTSNGSALTIVFSGTNGGTYQHYPTDMSGGTGSSLDFNAPKSGDWSGVAIYQDPKLTTGIDFTYAGNRPTWNISGLIYTPNASITLSGAINKSTNGATCLVMVTNDVTINGTGGIYQQSPNGSGCKDAGLNMPTAQIPGRAQLVY